MLKLLCVLAHPDDESLAFGGTLAQYAAQGIETSLIIATRGERGWRGKPEDNPGEVALGQMREREARQASRVLGISHLTFLDYIDGDLDQADAAEATAKIVRVLRQLRPNVVLTFGPDGLYGHPDHIAISQLTTAAVLYASDASYAEANMFAPHRVSKLYYRAATQAWFADYMPIFGDLVMHIDGQERHAYPWTDWTITTRLDTSASWPSVWEAVRCHQTQIPGAHILDKLSENDHLRLWGPQEYYRTYSLVNGGRKGETDLFEGLRSTIIHVNPSIWQKTSASSSLEVNTNVAWQGGQRQVLSDPFVSIKQ